MGELELAAEQSVIRQWRIAGREPRRGASIDDAPDTRLDCRGIVETRIRIIQSFRIRRKLGEAPLVTVARVDEENRATERHVDTVFLERHRVRETIPRGLIEQGTVYGFEAGHIMLFALKHERETGEAAHLRLVVASNSGLSRAIRPSDTHCVPRKPGW